MAAVDWDQHLSAWLKSRGWRYAVVLLLVGTVAFAVTHKDSPIASASSECRAFVLERLRDPSSADFSQVTTRRLPRGAFVVSLLVRANNGFGGKTVSVFTCTVKNDGQVDGRDLWNVQRLEETHDDGTSSVIYGS